MFKPWRNEDSCWGVWNDTFWRKGQLLLSLMEGGRLSLLLKLPSYSLLRARGAKTGMYTPIPTSTSPPHARARTHTHTHTHTHTLCNSCQQLLLLNEKSTYTVDPKKYFKILQELISFHSLLEWASSPAVHSSFSSRAALLSMTGRPAKAPWVSYLASPTKWTGCAQPWWSSLSVCLHPFTILQELPRTSCLFFLF